MAMASVIGQTFYEGALNDICPPPLVERIPVALAALTEKQFIRADPSTFAGECAFAFRHALIKDAAYQAMLKRSRAELHERFAGWLENKASDRVAEVEEILGYHLEQGYVHRRELGPLNDSDHSLGQRAARHLASAGRRAMGRGDMRAASALLQRAQALLGPADETKPELLADLGECLRMAGRLREAEEVLSEAGRVALGLRSPQGRDKSGVGPPQPQARRRRHCPV